jgi:DNA-binding transcriptional LysR family regulator
MEMQQLRHFQAVAEHGNMMRAAEMLHLTQPALSRSIRALEAQLDVRLFDRTPRGVSLTAFGAELLKHARVILNEQQRAVLSVNALRNGRKGHINVGVGHSFASTLLPLATQKLFARKSDVSMRVREGYYEELVTLLRGGELDLVLSLIPPPIEKVDDLAVTLLIEMRSEIVCNSAHPLADKPAVSIAELSRSKWLLQDQSHAARTFLDLFERGNLAPPALIIKTSSMSFLRGMLRVSDFLALVGDQLLADDIASGAVAVLKTDIPRQVRQAGAVTRAYGTTPRAAYQLIETLEALCKSQGRPSPRSHHG